MNRNPSTVVRARSSGDAPRPALSRFQKIAPPLVLLFLTFVSAALYDPLHRPLAQDPAIFAFLSGLVAQGIAPPQMAFNEQSSLAFLLGGSAMWLGNLFGLHPLLSFRFASILVAGTVVVLTYIVARSLTGSSYVGLLAGLILIGFRGYILRVATTLEPKSFMLVFGLAALYFLSKRKWFWAGVLGCAAGLVWQIAWGYLLVALLLAFTQGGILPAERARSVGLTIAGAAAAFLLYLSYFVAHGAQVEMLQQTFLAPLIMHNVVDTPLSVRIAKLGYTFYRGFGTHILFGLLGVLGLGLWIFTAVASKQWRAVFLRTTDLFFQEPRTAGTLLVILGFATYSMLDFQNYPDWIPLLPFISIFAAIFLDRATRFVLARIDRRQTFQMAGLGLVALLVLSYSLYYTVRATRHQSKLTWQEQQRVADEMNQQIPANAPIWLIGKTELLFFMGRHNLNKYIYLVGQVDGAVDALEPGGFDAMFRAALDQKPVLYVISRFKQDKFSTRHNYELVKNSTKGLVRLQVCRTIGAGQFYTQPGLADTLFPADGDHCIKRR